MHDLLSKDYCMFAFTGKKNRKTESNPPTTYQGLNKNMTEIERCI